MAHTCNSSRKQKSKKEFKASLDYIVSSRPARATPGFYFVQNKTDLTVQSQKPQSTNFHTRKLFFQMA